jgi:hypothetical protein
MCDSNINLAASHFSPHASLVGLGLKLGQLHFFEPVRRLVTIKQKVLKYTPGDKLYAGFVTILAGGQGMVEANKLVGADPALQAAFGLATGPDQSTIQATLDAATPQNLVQMYQAVKEVYQTHSQGYRHDYTQDWQILDGDMSGLPCGPKAALATKGYFAKQRNRRGRQLGRVVASRYQEIVSDQLFNGTTQLNRALPDLVRAAEEILELDEAKRKRTIWRLDSGAGSLAGLNWLLGRGYQILAKDCSSKRASQLCQSVAQWIDDPLNEGRQIGWISEEASEYVRPVKRIGVRCRKANQQWGQAVLVTTLSSLDVIKLSGQTVQNGGDPVQALLAYAYFYDQRGGGVETSFKEDKAGLGLSKRNKKRFEAQGLVVQLGVLAHNALVWGQGWLSQIQPKIKRFGLKRMVRDLLTMCGMIIFNETGHIIQIILNQADTYASLIVESLATLLATEQVAVNLGQT